MDHKAQAKHLLYQIKSKTKDEIVDILIGFGEQNIFIPVLIEFVQIARVESEHHYIKLIEECINMAYSPGLRSHILDDFIRTKLQIQSELNELKTKHNIYVLEQKLFMYNKAEQMLRSTSTSGSTYEIMKILEFRGDFFRKRD